MVMEPEGHRNRMELLQGTLDMLIPRTLKWGTAHGYGIVQALRRQSGEALQVETGSLYPALQRLERRGCVRSGSNSESNQRARYYRITAVGKSQLADVGRWEQMVEVMSAILKTEDGGET
jgi:PadR family transcriptional regulator PadR